MNVEVAKQDLLVARARRHPHPFGRGPAVEPRGKREAPEVRAHFHLIDEHEKILVEE